MNSVYKTVSLFLLASSMVVTGTLPTLTNLGNDANNTPSILVPTSISMDIVDSKFSGLESKINHSSFNVATPVTLGLKFGLEGAQAGIWDSAASLFSKAKAFNNLIPWQARYGFAIIKAQEVPLSRYSVIYEYSATTNPNENNFNAMSDHCVKYGKRLGGGFIAYDKGWFDRKPTARCYSYWN